MPAFETLDYPNMMGNIASELSRVIRVLENNEFKKTKDYLWNSLQLVEILKGKFPNIETCRLFEFLASQWVATPDIKDIEALQRYALNFYLNSLSKH